MVESVDGVGDFLDELKERTFKCHDAFTVAEVFNMQEGELGNFIGDDGYFSTMFDFSAHCLSFGEHGWYDAPPIDFRQWRQTIAESQASVAQYGYAYYRTNREKRILVAANFGSEPVELVLEYPAKHMLLGNMHSGLPLSDSQDSSESMDSTSGLKLDSCQVCVMECQI